MPNIDTSQMLPKGTMLHDNAYRIDSYLASGGFGNTYLATNIAFDEKVAIKEFFLRGQSERTDDMLSVRVTRGQELFFDEQKRKFIKEAQRIRRLRNPHIVRVHDLFEANGTAYYVMDYIDGESVAARIKRTGKPFSEDETRNILTQVLDALTEVHEAGIYHLDIKPDNILIDRKGNAYLIDFGASKVQSQSGDGVNCTSAFSATPEYAPLELTDGNIQNIGAWTDIYSIGATAYRMLTGVVPPRSSEVVIRGSEAFRFTAVVSQTMQKFISTCMAGDYRKRPQTAAATIDLLNAKPQVVVVEPKPQVVEHPKPQVVERHKPQVVERPKPQVIERPKPQAVEQPKPQPKVTPQPSRTSDATNVVGSERKKAEPSKVSNRKRHSKGDKVFFSVILGGLSFALIFLIAFKGCGKTDGKETFTVNGVDFNMIHVDVADGHDYSIGETEVTQELWQAVMGSLPSGISESEYDIKGDKRPVCYVNCNDCDKFIRKLNSLTGRTFRLPSEDEWEYAAKGGKYTHNYKYSGSNTIDDVAWYTSNTNDKGSRDVKTKSPNELGIYDMSGNVWEWTKSIENSGYVNCGFSWYSTMNVAWQVFPKEWRSPDDREFDLGFRLAL